MADPAYDLPENLFTQEDHTLQSFVERVFNDEPQDPQTYTLTLDTDFTNTPEDFKTVFEALTTVFTLAMRMKHANPATGQVDLLSVTHAQFERIQQYFRSFGFNVFYEATPFTQFNPEAADPDTSLNNDDLPSLADIGTEASPVTETAEQTAKSLDELSTTSADTLEDYFITLKTEQVKFKVWFQFLT